MRALSIILLGGLLAAGCAVGPNYERPPMVTPATYRGQAKPDAKTFGDLPWWEVFKDPTLQGLLVEAQKNNYDIRIAVTRVEQARALSAQAQSAFYPTVDYSGGVSKGRNTFLGNPSPNGGDTAGNALAVLNLAWEIDLWGKIRRSNEAARARLLATVEAQNGVMVSLIADVAQAYYELLELDLEKQIAVATTESFARSLKLFQDRLNAGAASKLDTSRAEASLASTAANIPNLERLIAIKENQICVLLGRPPGPIKRNTTLLAHAVPPQIPVGIPSTLLRRRPDVREAEANLIAANADIGVAVGQFFPQIGLTSLMGKVSPELSAFSSGASNAWSVAATVAGPLFNGGLLIGQYKQAKGAFKEAELSYERTVLVSLQEVSNALVTREKLEAIRGQQAKAVQAYQESVRLSILRYMAGKADYFEVIDAQQQLFPTENALAQTQLNRLTVVVQLYRALGGGWTEETQAQELAPVKKSATPKVSQSSKSTITPSTTSAKPSPPAKPASPSKSAEATKSTSTEKSSPVPKSDGAVKSAESVPPAKTAGVAKPAAGEKSATENKTTEIGKAVSPAKPSELTKKSEPAKATPAVKSDAVAKPAATVATVSETASKAEPINDTVPPKTAGSAAPVTDSEPAKTAAPVKSGNSSKRS